MIEMQTLKIKITENGILPINSSNETCFSSDYGIFKLYVVKDNATILYVGIAKQTIKARFQGSFRAYTIKSVKEIPEYNGYSGYKWIKEYINTDKILDLYIIRLNEINDKEKCEAIEAELVFLIRQTKSQWPLYQNEIHFHEKHPEAKEIAIKLLALIEK